MPLGNYKYTQMQNLQTYPITDRKERNQAKQYNTKQQKIVYRCVHPSFLQILYLFQQKEEFFYEKMDAQPQYSDEYLNKLHNKVALLELKKW